MAVVKRRPTGAIKELLAQDKEGSRLVGPINKHMMTKPLETDRRQDVLHPSEICSDDWCHRASCFILSGVAPAFPAKRNSAHLERVFEEGHAIHSKWQGWLAEMGVLYGAWRCKVCLHKQWGLADPEVLMHCKRCNSVVMEYAEITLEHPTLPIAGHADGWVMGLGAPYILEVKSVGVGTIRFEAPQLLAQAEGDLDQVWKNIRRPFKKHRLQAQLYVWLIEEMGLAQAHHVEQPKEIVFLYEFKPNQQAKEFVVPYDPESLFEILEAAKDIQYSLSKGEALPCNIDRTNGCAKCAPFKEQ